MKCLIFRRTEHKNTSNEQIAVPFGHEIAILWRNGHMSQLIGYGSQLTGYCSKSVYIKHPVEMVNLMLEDHGGEAADSIASCRHCILV